MLPAATFVTAQLPVVPPLTTLQAGFIKSRERQQDDVISVKKGLCYLNAAWISAACVPTNFFLLAVTTFLPAAHMACMRNGDECMDVPPSSPGSNGFYQRVVDVVERAHGQKVAWFFFFFFCSRRGGGGGGGKECSSRQNVVAVRGPEPAAVSAVVRILPFSGEFPLTLPL